MRGMKFGSKRPAEVYVALRWNEKRASKRDEEGLLVIVGRRLRCRGKLEIYNLCLPAKDLGMSLSRKEVPQVKRTIRLIRSKVHKRRSIRRIVVGGRTGPMPFVAHLLKYLL